MMSKFLKYIPKSELVANAELRVMEYTEKMGRMADDHCFGLLQNYARYRYYWQTVRKMLLEGWHDGHYEMMSEDEQLQITTKPSSEFNLRSDVQMKMFIETCCWNAVADVAKQIQDIQDSLRFVRKILIRHKDSRILCEEIHPQYSVILESAKEVEDIWMQVLAGNTEAGIDAHGYADEAKAAAFKVVMLLDKRGL